MADVPESTKTDAIDILTTYVDFIRNEVRADDFERHPYVPHIEQTIEDLRAAPPAMDREAVGADGYVLVPAVATRAMVDAADSCVDAYSAYAAMVQTGGKKPIFAADVLTEEWLADVLQDTLEMDWTTTDGARGIARALKNGLVTFPQSGGQILSTLSADAIRQGEGAFRPYSEWNEDDRDVLWWKLPVQQAPYVGSPLDLGFAVGAHLYNQFGEVIGRTEANVGGWPFSASDEADLVWSRLPATPASHASDGGEA